MSIYHHLLVAVEAQDEGEAVLTRAQTLARTLAARLSVVHVVEYLPIDPAGDALLTTPIDLSNERAEQAREQIGAWCAKLDIDDCDVRVTVGSITSEILRIREELNADLLVIGHHPRSGLMALFGHTDEGVLARASCDVLALNLRD